MVVSVVVVSVVVVPVAMWSSGGLQALLLKLHQSLSDEDRRAAALKCHDIVGDLAQECLETTTGSKLGERSPLISAGARLFNAENL